MFGDSDKQRGRRRDRHRRAAGTERNRHQDGIVSTLNRTIAVASSAAEDTPDESQQSPGGPPDSSQLPGTGSPARSPPSPACTWNMIRTDAAIDPATPVARS
ncbi:hypothetical protein QJS66_22580 [Kocuria rhizophila]|nr:hypothetical protein QJS66_22580 [Kocuria rhizophila]